jgi:demethylmenaquinone methyltransferase/2-methoxy-6-polyprenyl-1,4-benzoquinol methylase
MTRPFAPTETPPIAAGEPAWGADRLSGNPHEDREKALRVHAMFEAIARRYDLNNRLHSFGRDVAWRRAAVRAAGLGPHDEVLDVACGTGDLSAALHEAGVRRVLGVDFSQAMLDLAVVKSRRLRGPGAIEYRLGDAMNLDLPDASFDAVTIAFGLRNVAEPPRALREFRRVLRPGGRLVVLEFSEPRQPLVRWVNRLYTERIMPVTATVVSGDRSGAYRYLPRSVRTFPDPVALSGEIAAAGFTGVSRTPLTFGVCTIHAARVPAGSETESMQLATPGDPTLRS